VYTHEQVNFKAEDGALVGPWGKYCGVRTRAWRGCLRGVMRLRGEIERNVAMPLRLLAYMLEWKVSTQFEDFVHIPADLAEVLLPHVPKFGHALLDLSRYDPAREEANPHTRVVLQLMKLAREQQLQEFFRWLLGELAAAGLLPPEMLRLLLVYAMHVEGRIDEQTIYRTLEGNLTLEEQAMTIAQQLQARGKAEGKAEGEARGTVIGKLQLLQEMMGLPVSGAEEFKDVDVAEIGDRFEALQREYHARYRDR
ncbi:MAG TPA: hypothetical protein VD994_04770, partial [Prosthecobacter sp.]|nr:hypothetical protein [Prosthecobacter sp.]